MKRFIAFFLLGMTISIWADDRAVFQNAEQHFAAGEYNSARERYRDLIDEYPDSPLVGQAWLRTGQIQYSLRELDSAVLTLERVSVRYLSGTVQDSVHLWLGLAYYRLDSFGEAERELNLHLERRPDESGLSLLYRGLARYKLGNQSGAEEDLLAALESPVLATALAQLLSIYADSDRFGETVSLWETYGTRIPRGTDREVILRFVADAAYETDDMDLSVTVYEELTEYGLDNAQWAYFRLYSIGEAAGADVRAIYRRAEQRLAPEPERLAEFWYDLGRVSLESGRLEVAELYLRRLWDLRDEYTVPGQAVLYLADTLDRQGRRDEAIVLLGESLRYSSDREEERRAILGEFLLSAGREEEALEALEPALAVSGRLDSELMERIVYLSATAMVETGDLESALAVLERDQFSAASADHRELPLLRAWLLMANGRMERAVRAYREYLSLYDDDIEARRYLIRALLGAGETSAVLRESVAAIARDDDPYLRYYAGLAAFDLGRYEEAKTHLEAAREGGVDTPLLLYHLVWTYYRLGELTDALALTGEVNVDALAPELAFQVTYLKSDMLFRRSRYDEASVSLAGLLSGDLDRDKNTQIRRLLAQVYREAGRFDEALDQYREMILLTSDETETARIRRDYGNLLSTAGYTEQAVDELVSVNERFPGTTSGEAALIDAGEILFTYGNYTEARELFRRYRITYPEGSYLDQALYRAGAASVELGEPAAALLWWEPLIRTLPDSPWVPRTMLAVAHIYEVSGRLRRALENVEGLIARYPAAPEAEEAGLLRRRWRLELDGFSRREAELWAELDEAKLPEGSDRWFELILEVGRITIREQITLSSARTGIVDYLRQAMAFSSRTEAAEAGLLLGEYYLRQAEYRSSVETYLSVAELAGADDDQRAQSLFEVVQLAMTRLHDESVAASAANQLRRLYPDSIWTQRLQPVLEGGSNE